MKILPILTLAAFCIALTGCEITGGAQYSVGGSVTGVAGSGLVIQLQDGENYVAVWPKANAQKDPVVPYKGW